MFAKVANVAKIANVAKFAKVADKKMKNQKHIITYQILFWLWLAAILVLVYYPKLPTVKVEVGDESLRLDYIGHLGFYTVLMFLYLLWRSDDRYRITKRKFIPAFLLGILFAASTEITQGLYILGRAFNPMDLVCNVVGIGAGVGVFWLAVIFWAKKKAN